MNWEDYDEVLDAIEGRNFYSHKVDNAHVHRGRPVGSANRRKFDGGSRQPDGRLRANLTRVLPVN